MEQKAKPLEVRIQILNPKDWEENQTLSIRVKGLFRNSAWKVKNHTHTLFGNVIEINIATEKASRMGAMVLTPFEVIEDVPLNELERKYHIRAIVDGEDCAMLNF